MHIINIELENFKTIDNFAADFSGGVYLVTGENEIGKSTLLNAIGTLLTGQRTDNLLQKGKEKGFAKMTVGTGDDAYNVELRVTEKNPRGVLTVEKAGTGLKSTNLTALQSIFKYQDFDAHEFVKWSETAEGRRKQVDVVMSLLPAAAQKRINEIDAEVLRTKAARTPVNAEIKAQLNLLEKAGVTPDEIKKYARPKDLQKLIEQKGKVDTQVAQGAGVEERLQEREAILAKMPAKRKEHIMNHGQAMDNLEAEELDLKRQYEIALKKIEARRQQVGENFTAQVQEFDETEKALQAKIDEAKAWLKAHKTAMDLNDPAQLQAEIDSVQEHNAKAQKVQQYLENKKALDKKKAEKEKMEGTLVKLQEERQQLIDNSEIPIPGLDFTEEGLTLNGIPFKSGEVSTSQEMEVAAKLIIAKNPTVKVFRIAQGESLGLDRLNAIVEFANKNGYQGFIEEVHRGQEKLIVEKYQEKV